MYRKIKGYPGYVINPKTLQVIWKKGNELKPYKYPKCKSLRVSLYKDWKPTYVNIDDIIDKLGLGNDDWNELFEFFKQRNWKEIRKDGLVKKFEKFYIDEAIEEGVVVMKEWKKWYYIFNPDRLC